MCGVGVTLACMRRFFAFWYQCIKLASWGNAAFANDWQWTVANPIWQSIGGAVGGAIGQYIARYWKDAPVISPETAWGALLGGLAGFIITWLIAFTGRLFTVPAALYYKEKDRADGLAAKGEIPDVVIESPNKPDVVQRLPKQKGNNHPGMFVIFKNIRVINRDARDASIECRLHIKFADSASVRCTQIEPWEETLDDPDSRLPVVLGDRIPKVLNIQGRRTIDGHLACFISDKDMPFMEQMFKLIPKKEWERMVELVNRLPFELEVNEHISSRVKLIVQVE
jgi:hypothetical protein